jgi:transcriptional antiterminator NusG
LAPAGAAKARVGEGGMAKRWYTVSVLSNFEKKVAESIREGARQKGLEDHIEDILVPTEEVVEIRRGQKVHTERRFMPGYVLVRAEMSPEVQHMISNTNRVTGFLGANNKPMPMRDAEVERIIGQVKEGAERPRPQIVFQIGETVRVVDGPFESFSGQVEDIDEAHSRLKVSVSIFGRATPVELEYAQVAKAS